MNDQEEKNYKFLDRSIPSYVNRVRTGQWSADQASRFFSRELQKIKDRRLSSDLLNRLHKELKDRPGQKSSKNTGRNPNIIIDGPASIGSNQKITLHATTSAFPEEEGYQWTIEGQTAGVEYDLKEAASDGAFKRCIISTSPDVQNGVLYITASGTRSGVSGSTTVHIIAKKRDEQSNEPERQGTPNHDMEEPEEEQPDDSEESEQEQPEQPQEQNRQEQEPEQPDTTGGKGNRSNFLRNLIGNGRKNLLNNLKKRFSKAALQALWKLLLPYLPWIILAIIIIAAGLGIWFAFAKQASTGAAGSTLHQKTDPSTDAGALEKTILATGDKEMQTTLNNKTFTDIQKQLALIEDSAGNDAALKKQINETSAKIDRYIAKNDAALGREIVTSLKSILKDIDQQAPAIGTKTRNPISQISGFNWELHYGTPLRPEMPTGETGHATYMFYGQNKADAVDLYAAKGAPVYPAFSGKVVNITGDGTGHRKIVIQNGDYELLYANIDLSSDVKEGADVSIDTKIGEIANIGDHPSLHLELSYCGNPIITTLLDKINYDESENQKAWGEYLWGHYKKILNLK